MLFSQPTIEEGWDLVGKFIANLDGKLQDSSGNCHKLVASGEYALGVTIEKSAVLYADNPDIGFVYPEQNSAVPDGVALIKDCPNEENAKPVHRLRHQRRVPDRSERRLGPPPRPVPTLPPRVCALWKTATWATTTSATLLPTEMKSRSSSTTWSQVNFSTYALLREAPSRVLLAVYRLRLKTVPDAPAYF